MDIVLEDCHRYIIVYILPESTHELFLITRIETLSIDVSCKTIPGIAL